MSEASRIRIDRPLLLLLASVAMVAAAVFQAQGAVRRHRAQAEEALRDYTAFAGWSLRGHVGDAVFGTVNELLSPVNHGRALHMGEPPGPGVGSPAHSLRWDGDCYCHPVDVAPARYFAFSLGADTLAEAANYYAGPGTGVMVDTDSLQGAWWADAETPLRVPPPLTPAQARALAATLTAHVRQVFSYRDEYGVLFTDVGGRRSLVAYRPMPTAWADTPVYVVELPLASVRQGLADVLDASALLPPTFVRERTNRELLAVRVRDAEGRELWATEPPPTWRPTAVERLPQGLGGLQVEAALLPGVAETLLVGGVPRSRLPLLLALLGLATALALAALHQLRREQALAASRAAFVSSVSHELRTPLAQIRLYLETLLEGRAPDAERQRWSLAHIDRETTRLAHLVENVLSFARGTAADTVPAEAADLAAEARSAVADFAPLAASREATLEVDAPAAVPVTLDREAFRRVVLNLLDNAVKYGPTGQQVRVEVHARAGRARLTVADEGPGVTPAEREDIWTSFRRGQAAAASGTGGSGIGLAVVQRIVAAHEGTVRVEDAPGGGARFVVDLPLREG